MPTMYYSNREHPPPIQLQLQHPNSNTSTGHDVVFKAKLPTSVHDFCHSQNHNPVQALDHNNSQSQNHSHSHSETVGQNLSLKKMHIPSQSQTQHSHQHHHHQSQNQSIRTENQGQNSSHNQNLNCKCDSYHEALEERVRNLEQEVQFLRGKSKKDDEWKKLIQDWIYQQYDQKLRDFKNKLMQLTNFGQDDDPQPLSMPMTFQRQAFNSTATNTSNHPPSSSLSSCPSVEDESCSRLPPAFSNRFQSQSQNQHQHQNHAPQQYTPAPVSFTPNSNSSTNIGVVNGNCVEPGLSQRQNQIQAAAAETSTSTSTSTSASVIIPTPPESQAQPRSRKRSLSFNAGSSSLSYTNALISDTTPVTNSHVPPTKIRTVANHNHRYQHPFPPPPAHNVLPLSVPVPAPLPANNTVLHLSPTSKDSVVSTTSLTSSTHTTSASGNGIAVGKGTGSSNTMSFPATSIFSSKSTAPSGLSIFSMDNDDVIDITDSEDDANSSASEFHEADHDNDDTSTNDQEFGAKYFNIGYGAAIKTEQPEAEEPESADSHSRSKRSETIFHEAVPSSVIISNSSSNSTTTATTTAAITSVPFESPCSDKDRDKEAEKDKDSTPGKCKSRVCRDWRKICTYPSFQHARNDIMSSKAYTYRCKTESGSGTKTVYACKWYQKTRCPVALYVLQPSAEERESSTGGPEGDQTNEEVSVYETIGIVHNHTNYNNRKGEGTSSGQGSSSTNTRDSSNSIKKRKSRLSDEVQNLVRHLFVEGIRKPTGIMAAINNRRPELQIEMPQLKLFVMKLKPEYPQE